VSKVYTLHLECAADKAQEARLKLSKWYASASKKFPNGTKMRLVPLSNTILSSGNTKLCFSDYVSVCLELEIRFYQLKGDADEPATG
jgi:hypothetical protein